MTAIETATDELAVFLEEARKRATRVGRSQNTARSLESWIASANDVPVLLAEVTRLRGELARLGAYRVYADEDGELNLIGPCAWTIGCLFGRSFDADGNGMVPLAALMEAAASHEGPQGEEAHLLMEKMPRKPLAFGMQKWGPLPNSSCWLMWDGPGEPLMFYAADPETPGTGPGRPVRHPSADGRYQTVKEADQAAQAFMRAGTETKT